MKEKKLKHIEALTEVKDGNLLAIASTETEDRVGDSLKAEDWNLRNFKKNPVLQAGHDYKPEYTIGKAENIRVDEKNRLVFTPIFHGITELSKQLKEMYVNGWLKAWSVGYVPKMEEEVEGKAQKKSLNELLEISAVAVPANPEALTMVQKGMKEAEKEVDEEKQKEIEKWVKEEKCEDCGEEKVDEEEIDEEVEKVEAKSEEESTEATEETQEVVDESSEDKEEVKEKTEKQTYNCECIECGHTIQTDQHCVDLKCPKCGGEMRRAERPGQGRGVEEAKNKVVISYSVHGDGAKASEDEAWDAGAEVKKAVGDATKLKKMHTWVDTSDENYNAEERKWYKLPHHKGDGSQAVVWRGVAAAMGALLGARGGVDLPDNDKKGVYDHLAKHYKQFDKEAPELRNYTAQELIKLSLDEGIICLSVDDTINKVIEKLVEAREKEGRVLSSKNKKIVNDAIMATKQAVTALEKLLDATQVEKPVEPKNQTPKKLKGDDDVKSRISRRTRNCITSDLVVDKVSQRVLKVLVANASATLNKAKVSRKKK